MNASLHYDEATDTMEVAVMIRGKDITLATCHPHEEFMDNGFLVSYVGDQEVRIHHSDLGRPDLLEWIMEEGREWARSMGYEITN